ncbi:hypothetical protein Slin15195_G103670 [Septoria linicola]|uniref:Uncharacterized protein n=1 Tax=Septoria linicola TaxID=215465 RepID=A0A9Q9EQ02_9PEZI|nr:hypothetical protein Slin15195_G103670 [Septoria linicola]
MPSAWKRWWRNNLNKLKKKNKNRPIFDRDFNDDEVPPHTQQRPFAHGIDFPGPPLPPQAVARDPLDRFGSSNALPSTAATRGAAPPPSQRLRAASYSRAATGPGGAARPKSAGSSDSSESFRTAQQGFKY